MIFFTVRLFYCRIDSDRETFEIGRLFSITKMNSGFLGFLERVIETSFLIQQERGFEYIFCLSRVPDIEDPPYPLYSGTD